MLPSIFISVLLIGDVGHDIAVEDRVFTVEINRYYHYDVNGSGPRYSFTQMIFWHFSQEFMSEKVIAWGMLQEEKTHKVYNLTINKHPIHITPTGSKEYPYAVIFYHKNVLRRVRAARLIHTFTYYDREVEDRKILGQDKRLGLKREKKSELLLESIK